MNQPTTKPAPKSYLKLLLIILGVVIIGSALYYFLGIRKTGVGGIFSLSSPSPTPTKTATVSPTAGASATPTKSANLSPSANTQSGCAKENEKVSSVYQEYAPICCSGLTDNHSGMDTRISVADKCYQTGLASGYPVGTCINCGDNVCSEYENPCNCPQDCVNQNKSDFNSIAEFCQSTNFKDLCQKTYTNDYAKDLCNLCK